MSIISLGYDIPVALVEGGGDISIPLDYNKTNHKKFMDGLRLRIVSQAT